MPSPAVYVVTVVGAVAVGLAFKEFIYDPYIAPRLHPHVEAWSNELQRQRRRRRRGPVLVSAHPSETHSLHESEDKRSHVDSPLLRDNSIHELHEMGDAYTRRNNRPDSAGISTSTSRNTHAGSVLRQRSSAPNTGTNMNHLPQIPSVQNTRPNSEFLDIPNEDEIPYVPLSPSSTDARVDAVTNSGNTPNPFPSLRSPTLSPTQSQFSVGSDSVTIDSMTSPVHSSSPLHSRISIIFDADTEIQNDEHQPKVHLPTPPDTLSSHSPSLSRSLVIDSGENIAAQETESVPVINVPPADQYTQTPFAPSEREGQVVPLSMTSSSTSVVSYNTALSSRSPSSSSGFISFPTSPLTTQMQLDSWVPEEQGGFFTRSNTPSTISDLDSLVRSPFSNIDDLSDAEDIFTIRPSTSEVNDPAVWHVRSEEELLSDSTSEGSWEELHTNPRSP